VKAINIVSAGGYSCTQYFYGDAAAHLRLEVMTVARPINAVQQRRVSAPDFSA
jgi:hypothetical protein